MSVSDDRGWANVNYKMRSLGCRKYVTFLLVEGPIFLGGLRIRISLHCWRNLMSFPFCLVRYWVLWLGARNYGVHLRL